MGNYILSIDQGTTGSRVNILNEKGQVVGSAYEEFTQHFPKSGWVEHDAMEIWTKVEVLMSKACKAANVKDSDIAGIGITNQRETTVVWDKNTGEPVYHAIVWQCRRTTDICKQLVADGQEAKFKEKTGLVVDAYFSGTKIKWILDNVDGARAKAQAGDLLFGTIDTWLLFKLTAGASHKTDYTNASRTLIYNIQDKKWDDELCKILDIPVSMLPEVTKSRSDFGKTKGLKGFSDGVPVLSLIGDQQAALFGNLCLTPGTSKNTYGTGCFMLLNIGDKFKQSKNGLLTTLASDVDGNPQYALEGSVFIGGAVVQWLRDMVEFFPESPESEALAEKATEAEEEGLVFVPAFAGLGAPYWDMEARGAILGITRGTSKAAITKAALKSIALQSYDLMKAMEEDSGMAIDTLKVDGGATANNYLMQFQADILGKNVERPMNKETTALGAAFLAGLEAGVWKDADQLKQVLAIDKVFSPKMDDERRDKEIGYWHHAVDRILTKRT